MKKILNQSLDLFLSYEVHITSFKSRIFKENFFLKIPNKMKNATILHMNCVKIYSTVNPRTYLK
jgi:hypothetical protein